MLKILFLDMSFRPFTLLHSERSKLHIDLAALSSIGLKTGFCLTEVAINTGLTVLFYYHHTSYHY